MLQMFQHVSVVPTSIMMLKLLSRFCMKQCFGSLHPLCRDPLFLITPDVHVAILLICNQCALPAPADTDKGIDKLQHFENLAPVFSSNPYLCLLLGLFNIFLLVRQMCEPLPYRAIIKQQHVLKLFWALYTNNRVL